MTKDIHAVLDRYLNGDREGIHWYEGSAMTRTEIIKGAWRQAVAEKLVRWKATPVLTVILMDASEPLVYEKITYGDNVVIECSGVIVHTVSDLRAKGLAFQEYRKTRQLWDHNHRDKQRRHFLPALERKIERLEDEYPDFRQTYAEINHG